MLIGTGVKQRTNITSAKSASSVAAGAERLVLVEHARVARAEDVQHHHHHHRHHDPAVGDEAHHDRAGDGREREVARPIAQRRVGEVAAVELTERQQVPRRRQHAEPRGEHHRVDVDRVAVAESCRTCSQVAQLEEQRLAQRVAVHAAAARASTFDRCMPRRAAGTSTTKPPIGPAMAMSNSAARVGNASRILMTAPSVPDERRRTG